MPLERPSLLTGMETMGGRGTFSAVLQSLIIGAISVGTAQSRRKDHVLVKGLVDCVSPPRRERMWPSAAE